ncbi:C3a anaphylatoxin chemotactic receptor-like [Hemitrygon akajei]|uniref:C3a anaphylatoxin chemotactic receptor-like n=1 Tax=Hemitrygon akajei TaxID=2704970 RepID=UPI003BF9CCD3
MSSPEDHHRVQFSFISHANWSGQQVSVILSMIIFTIAFLLGVPGNSAVIWVTGFKMKRSVHSVCFLNLAVADLALCLTLPFWMVNLALRGSWDIAFKLLLFSICLNGSASVLLLTVISIFRCLSVTQPIWCRRYLRQCWAHVACSAAWVFALLICLIALLHPKLHLGNSIWNMLKVTWAVFIFLIPILVMAVCYFLIVRKLPADEFTKSRKSVRVIWTVIVVFIICWFPYHISSVATYFFGYFSLIWHDVALAMASFNSALNPLLYVFVGRKFRQVFKRSLASSLRLAFTELENDLPDNAVSTSRDYEGAASLTLS